MVDDRVSQIRVDLADDRLRSVSALGLFLVMLQIFKTEMLVVILPEISPTLEVMIDWYTPILNSTLIVALYLSIQKKIKLPELPPAWTMVKRYSFWFVVFFFITFIFIYMGGFGLLYYLFGFATVRTIGIGSWLTQLIVGLMENLSLVMFLPFIIPFHLGGKGIVSRIVEYIPAGIVAALSHTGVYWTQIQTRAAQLEAQGLEVNMTTMLFASLFIAFIAFTIFYLVYRIWGFAASVALHQTFNMNNMWINGA